MTTLDQWIQKQLAKFPPLTSERWAIIAAILAGSRQRDQDYSDSRLDRPA
jgi:hypothetical protein